MISAFSNVMLKATDLRLSKWLFTELNAQLLLEQLQLLADARLARIQALRGRRDVQATVSNRDQVFELLKSHRRRTDGGSAGEGAYIAIGYKTLSTR